jgi:alpha-glucosidase
MRDWWRDAVIYQIYPRSFQDDNGDGIGDLPGITRRLDHVASLGVDAIWLSPFFTSPDKDMGYDVSDYTNVNPVFGTLADFDALVAKAHALGLKVIIDQVISHTSDQHPWFQESRQSKTNPKADWYVWADPQPDGTPPNNWPSVFGGSAWMFEARRRQYYLHNFLTEQPDLNFHTPETVDALLETMRFWLDRGVDGFRLDTVNFYVHDKLLRDNPPSGWTEFPGNPYEAQDHIYSKTRPENIGVLRRIRALTDEYDARMLVGEVGESIRPIEVMAEYTSGSDRLHMAYSFEFLGDARTAAHFRSRITNFLKKAPDGWPCWSFSNHDVKRHASRWTKTGGDIDAVARQSIALLCSFPGTLGIYQGEELGQTETDIEFHELTDLGYIDFWPDHKGRDGCRTPMVWEAHEHHAAFTTGVPWLPVKAPQAARAVDLQEADVASVLNAYRATLSFRKSRDELRLGTTEFPVLPEPLLAIRRSYGGKVLTGVFNLSDQAVGLTVEGKAQAVGPKAATLAGGTLELSPNGFIYLEEEGAVNLAPSKVTALA